MRKRRIEYVRISNGGTAADLKRQQLACERFLRENGTCGIYVRSATGNKKAMAAQEAVGIALCRKKGWGYQVFREAGLPGGVLRKLVEAVKAGKIHYVFVYTADRLSRDISQWFAVFEEVVQRGGKIITPVGSAADCEFSRIATRWWALARQRSQR